MENANTSAYADNKRTEGTYECDRNGSGVKSCWTEWSERSLIVVCLSRQIHCTNHSYSIVWPVVNEFLIKKIPLLYKVLCSGLYSVGINIIGMSSCSWQQLLACLFFLLMVAVYGETNNVLWGNLNFKISWDNCCCLFCFAFWNKVLMSDPGCTGTVSIPDWPQTHSSASKGCTTNSNQHIVFSFNRAMLRTFLDVIVANSVIKIMDHIVFSNVGGRWSSEWMCTINMNKAVSRTQSFRPLEWQGHPKLKYRWWRVYRKYQPKLPPPGWLQPETEAPCRDAPLQFKN